MSVKTIVRSGKNRVCKIISKHPKLSRVIAAVLAFAMIIGLVLFANPLFDYPLYAPFFKLKAQNYIKKNYGEMGYVMESFKDFGGEYFAVAAKPDSPDSRFTVIYYASSSWMVDGYEYDVLRLNSVRKRLQREYDELAGRVLKSPQFPYVHSSAHLSIEPFNNGYISSIPAEILELDGIYDIRELGSQAGFLRVIAYTDEITPEKAAEALLEIDRLMTKGGVTYFAIDLLMETDHASEGDEYFNIRDFLRRDIYEEGLVERVAKTGNKGKVMIMYPL